MWTDLFFLFLTAFVQGVRGLLMCGITLGFFAVVLCFIGMECTYIGGADKTKDKLVFAGAIFHFVGGKYRTRTCFASVNEHKCFAFILFSVSTIPPYTGMSNISGYCLYINRIARTTFAPSLPPGVLKYSLSHYFVSLFFFCFNVINLESHCEILSLSHELIPGMTSGLPYF